MNAMIWLLSSLVMVVIAQAAAILILIREAHQALVMLARLSSDLQTSGNDLTSQIRQMDLTVLEVLSRVEIRQLDFAERHDHLRERLEDSLKNPPPPPKEPETGVFLPTDESAYEIEQTVRRSEDGFVVSGQPVPYSPRPSAASQSGAGQASSIRRRNSFGRL